MSDISRSQQTAPVRDLRSERIDINFEVLSGVSQEHIRTLER